ncbi:lipoyl(octanoyl) transferase LipB [Micropruina sonneratiae]|uniref:lipoyl(octanoyl) transferase LipB n=1 Tax=Micropruina sonneratiae TaxID=2986940 RepID=UPI0022272F3B|nr:lipoyl(octanoyl) transferase LipB [Micropruina sp. KQZ13P-5]MCW3156821.1 lipoyl(octanoyl) transferase LipB [Micropruina sp. KQZ13P-5]
MPEPREADARATQFQYLGLTDEPPRLSPYLPTWEYQRQIHARVASGELPPQVLYVEHEPVYTAGRRTEPHERPFDGTPVVDVDRGGKITWHGPGQLVGYPIVFLPRGVGVVDYVRRVEEALIRVLADYGLDTGRVEGRTGVWLPGASGRPERKIAAIGIRVSKQTTMHGFALNVTSQLGGFDNIVPCGIADAGVTSMAAELSTPVPTLVEVAQALEPHLSELLALRAYHRAPEFATG